MLARERHLTHVEGLLGRHPIVAILGARQIGKTTLARQLLERWEGPRTVFDLEDPFDLARLREPRLVLEDVEGLVVIDEVQQQPGLFPIEVRRRELPAWSVPVRPARDGKPVDAAA